MGGFPPIFKAFDSSAAGSLQCSLRGYYYAGPESDTAEDEQFSLRRGPGDDYYPDLGSNVEVGGRLSLRGEGLVGYDFDTNSDDVDDEKWTVVEKSPRKLTQRAEKDLGKDCNEVKASTSKSKDNCQAPSAKAAAPAKSEVTTAAWQRMRRADRETVPVKKEAVNPEEEAAKAKSHVAKITSIDDPVPLSWRAKAAAAAEKVEAVMDASKRNHSLKLTPAALIHRATATSLKQTVSLNLDLANLPHQSKKIQIANKLINTLNIQGALAKEIILKGVTQACGTYSGGGIHVFIDASNIQLGFQDALKKNAGLTDDDYVNNTPSIIFECLSFILERGRPVNKREIVGSSINGMRPEYFKDAEACGYRATAPEKVKKWRTKKNWVDGKKVEVEREAYFEQLVDEYIHRQISNSLLDAKEPGTMVLATGDANGAEYDDDGFLQYVQRALERDWKVEVVAWTGSMSSNWKKLKETSKFGDNLTIISLDEFREDLTRDRTPADKAADCWWWRQT